MNRLSDAEYTSKLFSENRAEEFRFDYGLKRLRRTDFEEVRKPYEWEAHGERFSLDAVRQTLNDSCVHACAEMLSEGRLLESELIAKHGSPMSVNTLLKELGPGWDSDVVGTVEELAKIEEFSARGSWMAIVYDSTGLRGHHAIVIDGKSSSGNLMVRDPFEGTKYEMTFEEFLKKPLWTGRCVHRIGP